MSDITERLRARRLTRWINATGQTPQASGYSVDAECQEAADVIESLRAEVAVLQMACSRWERALEHGADRIRNAENESDSLRAQVEALRADAERLDALDELSKREASTDIHLAYGRCAIYVRTGIGSQIEREGHGDIRAAIDAARAQEAK